MLILWKEGLNPNLNPLIDQIDSVGYKSDIYLLPNKERRFQAIKHGSSGESRILVKVTDDKNASVGESSAVWLPLGLFIINSTKALVQVDGTTISNPLPDLTCGFVSKAGWKYVMAEILEHSGDPVSLIMGL